MDSNANEPTVATETANEPTVATETTNDVKSSDRAEEDRPQHLYGDGASPAKIFIGGLARDTTTDQFNKHFGKYGEITDSVIMKDRNTGQPRGFGFVTYADASVVDEVIKNDHIINGKQVEIKRTIPKGTGGGSKVLKTKKIFVGGIPATVTDDELKDFFMQFGEVKEHQIMRDHSTSRSRGFGFVSFDTEQAVDDLLAKGNRLDFADAQVEIKKAEPRKTNPSPAPSKRYNDSRPTFGRGSYGDAYGGFEGGGGMGAGYRSAGAYERRASAYGGLGGSEFGGYGTYGGGGSMGPYRGEPSPAYSSRYGGGFSRGYDMGGGYGGPGEGYGGYGGAAGGGGGYGGAAGRGGVYGGAAGGGYGYGAGLGGGYGAGDGPGAGAGGGSFYGSDRGGYGGAGTGRYHPYGR